MSLRRSVIAIVAALVAAAVFVWLGVWQLHRWHGKRAANAIVRARLAEPPLPLDTVLADTVGLKDRRVTLAGRPDYAHELVLVNRSHDGAPGVNLLTPLRIPGRDTAVLVNRGWVYSPDAGSVNLPSLREGDALHYTGYLAPFEAEGRAAAALGARAVRRLDPRAIAGRVPYPLAPFVVIVTGGDPPRSALLVRLSEPALDDGPHLSYAVQWFSFAAIAVFGVGALVWHDRERAVRPEGSPLARDRGRAAAPLEH